MKKTETTSEAYSLGRIAPPPEPAQQERLRERLLQLLFPRWCPVCGMPLTPSMPPLCLSCRAILPHYHESVVKGLDRLRGACHIPIRLYSPYLYNPGGPVQRIVWDVKYKGNLPLAVHMGRLIGSLPTLSRAGIDCIIPVPLSSGRALERGFNQAELIAEGISSVTRIPYLPNALIRKKFHGSQTHRGRTERLEAVIGCFEMGSAKFPPDSHLLIVDDVLTTGATLTAAIEALREYPAVRVSAGFFAVSAEE